MKAFIALMTLAAAGLVAAGCGKTTPTATTVDTSARVSCSAHNNGPGDENALGLVWEHRFWCLSAPNSGTISGPIGMTNPADNTEAIIVTGVAIEKLSPRPLRESYVDAFGAYTKAMKLTTGVGTRLAPGESGKVDFEAPYVLIEDDESDGAHANLHIRVLFKGETSGKEGFGRCSVHILRASEPDVPAEGQGGKPWERPGGPGTAGPPDDEN